MGLVSIIVETFQVCADQTAAAMLLQPGFSLDTSQALNAGLPKQGFDCIPPDPTANPIVTKDFINISQSGTVSVDCT